MKTQTITMPRNAANAARLFDQIMANASGRFVGFENVTAKGIRRWSLASRPPRAEIAALTGKARAPDPAYIRRVYDAGKRAWRSVDLSTARAIWFSVNGVTIRYEFW